MKTQTCSIASGKSGVLIVEDDRFLGESLEDMLGLIDIDTHLARDGLTGEAIYRQYQDRIDLIILDLSLPVQDGVTTLHKVRQINADVGVIILSGYEEAMVRQQIPLDDFRFVTIFTKPFEINAFLNEVKRLLA